jgi:hypothetical protein
MLNASADLAPSASISAKSGTHLPVTVKHTWHVECFRDGKLIWEDTFENLVTTAGLNKYLDATLKTGLASPSWFVGLVDGPGSGTSYAAGDVMSSHGGWTENQAYDEANRQAFTPGTIAAGSVDNSAAKAVFTMNSSDTIAGAFLVDENTKGGTTGTLLGEGDFTAGDRSVIDNDVLNVTVTATITAS